MLERSVISGNPEFAAAPDSFSKATGEWLTRTAKLVFGQFFLGKTEVSLEPWAAGAKTTKRRRTSVPNKKRAIINGFRSLCNCFSMVLVIAKKY